MTDKPKRRSGIILNLAAVPVAAALLLFLSPMPAEAKSQWLARGLAVGGAGYALKEHLGELTDRFGEMVDAAMEGDTERAGDVWEEVGKTPGRLIKNAFPVLKLGDAALAAKEGLKERLKSAERKIGRFVGGVGESVADARVALAVGAGERDWYESRTGILARAPLPVTVVSGTRAAPKPLPKADPWADDTTKVGQSGDVWGDDAGEDDRSAYDWASAETETDPWGRDPGTEPDGPPGEAVAGYNGDEQREAEQWQSEYTVALNRFLGLDDGDDDYEAALNTVERLEREAIRRQEERERQARLEEQERMEATRQRKERERRERLAAEQRARQRASAERAEASQAAISRGILTGIQNATAILQGQMSVIQQQQAQRRQLAALKQQQARQRRAEQERYQQQLQRQQQEAAEQQRRQADRQARLEQELRRRLQACEPVGTGEMLLDDCYDSTGIDHECEDRNRQAIERRVQERERQRQECKQRAWSLYKKSGGATILGVGRL